EIKNKLEVFSGDIRDPFGVKQAMKDCDIVMHLAALIAIPYSYHSPDTYIDTNIKGTLNIVQAARELGIEKVIQTSTSEVYGTAKYVPIDEKHPLQGQSPYSASKIGSDQIALSYFCAFDTPIAVIRPFNTYGPRQSARAVIPTIITQILSGKKQIKLGALSPTRDFNYVQDTVDGFIAITQSEQSVGEIINIGSNFEISIDNMIKTIIDIMGVEVEIITDNQRIRPEKSEVERLWCDNKKALSTLDWQPKYAGLDGFKQGIRETVEWFSNKENLLAYKTNVYNI
ncbi:MAG: NAD-dependent epimerase/dehydratase family protein, partial [Methylococcales bacterium]|nr:NAD-dependent epimerase/dehydratase family protein [Methylococcales bacterium]